MVRINNHLKDLTNNISALGTGINIFIPCGTFLDMLISRIIFVIRDICHADQE